MDVADPFEAPEADLFSPDPAPAEAARPAPMRGRRPAASLEASIAPGATEGAAAASTYEFRWDVEVPGTERRFGQKFMKQWKRVLQAQKMAPLVSSKLSPRAARFQLCLAREVEAPDVSACEAAVAAELAHLRWAEGRPEERIRPECPERHPVGWQGVRVWMTFARQDVESVLGRKSKV